MRRRSVAKGRVGGASISGIRMGDVLDATPRFRAREYSYRWDAFCCGQMSVLELIAEIKADRHFSDFCVERVRELRARQIEAAVRDAIDWDNGA